MNWSNLNIPTDLAHVAVRKTGLDNDSALWRRLYLRLIWRPFLRFSFKHVGIPAPHKLEPDGSFTFLEGIGIATDKETAQAMCRDENYRIAWLPLNAGLPKESVQYKGHVYPKSVMPNRYRRRTFPTGRLPTAVPVCIRTDGIVH